MSVDEIKTRLARSLDLTDALADSLSDAALAAHNGKAKSNTIGGQFWCLVGARESYGRAFKAGAWQGFACSLENSRSVESVKEKLRASRDSLARDLDAAELNDARIGILMDLAEHEVQHHGQLIRYFYANDLPFPAAFASRYALD
jgi:hypothetical protein